MEQNKGRIDVAAGQKFLADHYDSFEGKEDPDERTLDGHIDLSPRGSSTWVPPHGPAGAVQNKVTDAAGIEAMSFTAHLGHACGMNFKAATHLAKYPDASWYKPILRDMDARGWARFAVK
jgi:hypothetical protein